MKTTLRSLLTRALTALTVALLWTAATQLDAADPKPSDAAGKWTWTLPGRNGGPERTVVLRLRVEGTKLSGKLGIPTPDGLTNDVAIEDAKMEGADISFKATREYNGNKVVSEYQGKLSGDTIKGKVQIDRGGQKQSRDWEAKRETEKK